MRTGITCSMLLTLRVKSSQARRIMKYERNQNGDIVCSDGNWIDSVDECVDELNHLAGAKAQLERENAELRKDNERLEVAREYDSNGNETYREHSNGYWCKYEYDANGNRTYYEDSDGNKEGTPRAESYDKTAIRPLTLSTPHHLGITSGGVIVRKNEDGSILIFSEDQEEATTFSKDDATSFALWILAHNANENHK